ncbi:carbohydrate binding domain-containing protein [Paenibacillus hodogayensis]|uniref:Carbohydrate binding domain-containing protein n=1 Tax=Paenibacillus hodogayensis TaxID=279208 RepID=A0ABV5VVX2_9BACL
MRLVHKGLSRWTAMLLILALVLQSATLVGAAGSQEGRQSDGVTGAVYDAVYGTEPVSLVLNGGFEEEANGIPLHWKAMNDNWNGGIARSAAAAYAGQYGISIQTATTNNPWVVQIVPVEEGVTYELSSFIKATGVTQSAGYKVEYYKGYQNTGENWINASGYSLDASRLTGDWQAYKEETTAPRGARYAYMYLRLYGTGTVFFDEVSMRMSKPKPSMTFALDHQFYYTDWTEGHVRLDLQKTADAEGPWTADIRIADKETQAVVFQSMGIAAAPHLDIPFLLSLLNVRKPYEVEATLRNGSGQIVEQERKEVYRWERPVALPQNGPILVDGEPFYPIIMYHVDIGDFARVKEIGVNTVQGKVTTSEAVLQNTLDAAQLYGLKVIVPLYPNMKVKENADLLARLVNRFKTHPAVLAWMIMDEPTPNGIPLTELLDAYRSVRTLDPLHATYMVEISAEDYDIAAKATDVFVIDHYPLPRSPIATLTEHVQAAERAVGHGKPIWSLLQAFRVPGTVWSYLPTIEEIRNMAYQGVLSGATGLGYYSLRDPGWNLATSELWSGLVDFREELELISTLVTDSEKIDGVLGTSTQWGLWRHGDERYVVALNLTKEPRTLSVPLDGSGYGYERIFGSPPVSGGSTGEELELTLGAEQTVVFRLTPFTTAADRSLSVMEEASGQIFENDWRLQTSEIVSLLEQLEQKLALDDTGAAVWNALLAREKLRLLNEWVREQVDATLEGKRDLLLDRIAVANETLHGMAATLAETELQVTAQPVVADDSVTVSVYVRNQADAAFANMVVTVEQESGFAVENVGTLAAGDSVSFAKTFAVADEAAGPWSLRMKASFVYKGIPVTLVQSRTYEGKPRIQMKVGPDLLNIKQPGAYPFTLELSNGSGASVPVELTVQSPGAGGLAVSLNASSAILAARGVMTVQGTVYADASVEEGNYSIALHAGSGGAYEASAALLVQVDDNKVVNGSFEPHPKLGSLEGWSLRSSGVWDFRTYRSGSYAVRLSPDAANANNRINTSGYAIDVTPGETYLLQGWMKNASTAGTVVFGVREVNASGGTVRQNFATAAKASDWRRYEVAFTAQPATVKVEIVFLMDVYANGDAWLDDVYMQKQRNRVRNGDFEAPDASGVKPDGWALRSADAAWVHDVSHRGNSSVRLQPNSQNAMIRVNTTIYPIIVSPGDAFTLKGWIKNESSAGSVAFGVREINASGSTVRQNFVEAAKQSDWSPYEVTFTTQPATVKLEIVFQMDTAANGMAWLDDVFMSNLGN